MALTIAKRVIINISDTEHMLTLTSHPDVAARLEFED